MYSYGVQIIIQQNIMMLLVQQNSTVPINFKLKSTRKERLGYAGCQLGKFESRILPQPSTQGANNHIRYSPEYENIRCRNQGIEINCPVKGKSCSFQFAPYPITKEKSVVERKLVVLASESGFDCSSLLRLFL